MPPPRQLVRIALILLLKLVILGLIFPFLLISNILLQALTPSLLVFHWPAFLSASAAVIACCSTLSWCRHDWHAAAVGTLTAATAGVMFMHGPTIPLKGAEWLFTALSAPAAISFLYRNRITDPMLVLPALFVLAYLFVDLLYTAIFLLWVHFTAGYSLFHDTPWNMLLSCLRQLLPLAPTALLYWLGKHGYAPWLRRLQVLLQRRRA